VRKRAHKTQSCIRNWNDGVLRGCFEVIRDVKDIREVDLEDFVSPFHRGADALFRMREKRLEG
jgi:hypothetical protein